jgi:hypothetical protein
MVRMTGYQGCRTCRSTLAADRLAISRSKDIAPRLIRHVGLRRIPVPDRVEYHRRPAQMFGGRSMRFGYTILYVEDVAVAITFSERAFGRSRRFITDDATSSG